MKLQERIGRWLIAEAAVATLIPAALLMISLPLYGPFIVTEAFFPIATDTRSPGARLAEAFFYLGSFLAVVLFWCHIIKIKSKRGMTLGIWTFLGLIGGISGSIQSYQAFGLYPTLLIAIPPWLVTLHAAYLLYSNRKI